MQIKELLKKLTFSLSEIERKEVEKKINFFLKELKNKLQKNRINAQSFLGGSAAKGTMHKANLHDIDIFLRFNEGGDIKKNEEKLSKALRELAQSLNYTLSEIEGSRRYYQIQGDEKVIFEIVPVKKIKNPNEAENVTDLGFFHVKYMVDNLNNRQKREVVIAKAFAKSCEVYGAESYIQGFSGYALECLILTYGSFDKMLKSLAELKGQLILDPAKHYKNKDEVLINIQESKRNGPIILVDPTWKERNVLAALNNESLAKMQSAIKEFLKNPSEEFFRVRDFDLKKWKEAQTKKGLEFVEIILETNKKEGDIAGTKMKKFSRMITLEISKDWEIKDKKFIYQNGKEARFYLSAKLKKDNLKLGPPIDLKKHALAFKKEHPSSKVIGGRLVYSNNVNLKLNEYLEQYSKNNKKKFLDMDITEFIIRGVK